MELGDLVDSKSTARKGVRVRVPLLAPFFKQRKLNREIKQCLLQEKISNVG